jgi:hypothetical protein
MSTDVFLRNHVIPFITRASEVGLDLFLVSPVSWSHSGEWHDILLTPEKLLNFADSSDSLFSLHPPKIHCDTVFNIDVSNLSSKIERLSLICSSQADNTSVIVNDFNINVCSIRATLELIGGDHKLKFVVEPTVKQDIVYRCMHVTVHKMNENDVGSLQRTKGLVSHFKKRGFRVRRVSRVEYFE